MKYVLYNENFESQGSFATVQEHEAWCGRGLRAETDWSADPTLLNQLKVQGRDPSLADWAGALDLHPLFCIVQCTVSAQVRSVPVLTQYVELADPGRCIFFLCSVLCSVP